MVLAAGSAPALATLSTSCLCCWTTRAKWMGPPAGAAPARLSYKGSLRAAARRRRMACRAEARQQLKTTAYALARFGAAAFARSSVAGGGWSQSPVLPWAQRAYETCLSAGSTATLPDKEKWGPHPELHRVPLPTEQAHRSKCFGGAEIGRRETTCTSKAAWF